ncbi:MAG: alpha-amylase family glycosyl hydrolase [Elusimicrobiota bacterium]
MIRFKKILASLLSASLLIAQQGFLFRADAAVKVNVAGTASGGGAAAAAGGSLGVNNASLNSLQLSNQGLNLKTGVLPSVGNIQAEINPQSLIKSVALPKAVAAQGIAGKVKAAESIAQPGAETKEAKVSPSAQARTLSRELAKSSKKERGGLLSKFFDSSKHGLSHKDAAVEPGEGDFGGGRSGLNKKPGLKELRTLLVDGTVAEDGPLQPFGFRTPDGTYVAAPTAGLESFFEAKQTHEWRHGEANSSGQVNDYFNYLDALLAPLAWTVEIRRDLRTLKLLAMDDLAKNRALNELLIKTVGRIQSMEVKEILAGSKAPNSLEEATLDIDPNREYYPSPEDWRDEVIYFSMIDRFSRSKKGMPRGDPKDGGSRHGGDIRGIIDRLDYIKESGVTSILFTPVTMGLPKAYHGYAPLHLLEVDPHLGTMEDYKEMVREAHKRGIRVIMDLVLNHTGPVFEYKDGSRWSGVDKPRKEIDDWTFDLKPVELKDAGRFSRRGVIDDWQHPDQVTKGDFPPNYRHFRTDDPKTRKMLTQVALWWLKETDVDGFRLDAIRHVDPSFWPEFNRAVRQYAAKLGKKNFFLLGENSTGVDWELLQYMGKDQFDSTYNYPSYRRDNKALHGAAPTKALEDSIKANLSVLGGFAGYLLRFIDLHDTYRFLRSREPINILKLGMTYLMFSLGIPIVYAGTEQAMRQYVDSLDPEGPHQPADPQNREDMFPEGQFKSESSKGDMFNAESDTFKFLRRLADLRQKHPALRRGEHQPRWVDPYGPGIYAFSRIYGDEEVLVVMNTSGVERSASMYVDAERSPGGTRFADELDRAYTGVAKTHPEGGSMLDVTVPANGVRVLVRRR